MYVNYLVIQRPNPTWQFKHMVDIYSGVSCPLKLRDLHSYIQQFLIEHLWHHIQSDCVQSPVHRELIFSIHFVLFSEKENLDEKVAILIIH